MCVSGTRKEGFVVAVEEVSAIVVRPRVDGGREWLDV
jgi:hypothetical protein